MKKYLLSIGFLALSSSMMAQGGTMSPYSQFGVGKLSDQSQSQSRGMNGVGLAFREHNQVNSLNPASYSSIDSVTFIFDVGMSLQSTSFKENDGTSKTVRTADFEYATATFRVKQHLGVGLGLIPYSNIGYEYAYTSAPIPNYHTPPFVGDATTYSMAYSGDGGLHEFFAGVGWEPKSGLSVGFNIGYLWGNINNYVVTLYSDNSINSFLKQYTAKVSSFKLDLGVQYSRPVTDKDVATVGVKFSPGHKLGADAECLTISGDSAAATAENAYAIPTEFGIGFAWKHKKNWKVGLDYTMQKWGSIASVSYIDDKTGAPTGRTTSYKDSHKINIGGEYCKNEDSRRFKERLRYRFGMGYTSPYFNIGDKKGPREISMSAGVGIPIVNGWNNRSVLNIGLSWHNFKSSGLLSENTLLVNIGVTFNERWFAKWKFE